MNKKIRVVVKTKENNEHVVLEKIKPRPIWKSIWLIITNKSDNQTYYTELALASVIAGILNAIAVFCAIFIVVIIIADIMLLIKLPWQTLENYGANIISIICILFCILVLFMVGIIFRACANEILKEKDKHYLMNAFFSLMTFLAFLVAIITLLT